jgi:hypothetical protein
MKLFTRRKKTVDPNLPPEVQAYSQAEHRERMGVAWLVGIVSLIISLAVITGLFFGGRWAYRKLAHKDSKPTPAVTNNNSDQQEKKKSNSNSSNSSNSNNQGDQEQTPPPPTTSQNNSTSQQPSQQPATGDTLPNTGPDVDL